MRKILMLSLAAMVALVACEKEEVKKPGQDTDEPAAEDTRIFLSRNSMTFL